MIHTRAARKPTAPIVVSVPHAGVEVPPSRAFLKTLPRETFLRDVDFEVHRFWEPVCEERDVSFIRTDIHRYAIDLNRRADQYHRLSVEGAEEPGAEPQKTLFWYETTRGEKLLPQLLTAAEAQNLVRDFWSPYYGWIERELVRLKDLFGFAILIDAHSMPSRGTSFHTDSGSERADIVPGDLEGRACDPQVLQAARDASQIHGFRCAPNDPYKGGGITQTFGRPPSGFHALQIEVKRGLYMFEDRWELKDEGVERLRDFARDVLRRVEGLKL